MAKGTEKVTYNNGSNVVMAIRESNQTLVVPRTRKNFPDSDKTILEDKHGHRYTRNIALENYINSVYYIFNII